MKAFIKILGIVLIFGLVFGFTGNQPAMAADGPVCNTNSGLCYTTIQAAITAATEGDTITIANGTYNEALNIDRSLTLDGESEAGVIINTGSFADYGIDAGGDITTYFRDFTLIGSPSSGSTISTYGFKVSGENAFTTIEHVTVQGYGRSGIDLNGLAGGTVNDVTVSGSLDGVGLALTDSSNIAVSNVTTSGNAWAGMAIFTKGASYVGGSSGVTLSGTN
ncbi:MAG TPA: hypothetical protein PLY85_11450, partial [Anaerolineaceae bacterium]|nr:hypothetical protein [Anaerolineaceae bacterium]